MAEPRRKTLSYHRAQFFNAEPGTINLGLSISSKATDKLQSVAERSLLKPGGYPTRLAHFQSRGAAGGGALLHLTIETPGEHASVVPKVPEAATELRVATLAPPNDAEYMDGDAFLYVKDNDVCLCTTAVTLNTVRHFLHAFFEAAKIRRDAGQFDLMNAVDNRKVALIHSRRSERDRGQGGNLRGFSGSSQTEASSCWRSRGEFKVH